MTKLEPQTLLEDFKFLRREPEKYLALAEEEIKKNPNSADGYCARHHVMRHLGRNDEALADIEKAIAVQPHWVNFESKGIILRDMGRYREALAAFNEAQRIAPEEWPQTWAPIYRADTHAKLSNEQAALADCALIWDGHWHPPGVDDLPGGTKQEIADELRRRAAAAKQKS